uniref:Alpha-1,6-mannosyl-glycoprotein 2-beta-N-acetylglucosaminyltransferase n=1 Tax=Schistocephalus solidus TaxID=70667 RepID=A0A0X3Q507_SCHSO
MLKTRGMSSSVRGDVKKIRTNEHLQNLLDKGILKSPEENGFREEPLPSFRAPLQKEIRSDLKGNVRKINQAQKIFGESFLRVPPKFVLVIQVHERFENLIALIDSLSRVHGIEDTLLVFSHDVFLDEINSLVANIGFAPVLQIFYPYSIQIYNSSFPAQDPRDCPRTLTNTSSNCLNKDWPDFASHYREANVSQTKNHWFWKLLFASEKLTILRDFDGYFLLLEEDHLVLDDILHVLQKAIDLGTSADIISLGSYTQPDFTDHQKVYLTKWRSSRHNMGMAMNRKTIGRIRSCSQVFCTYDDYNWDWSLQFVGLTCFKPELTVLHFNFAPRVYHTGVCGMHSSQRDCDVRRFLAELQAKIDLQFRPWLFPEHLELADGEALSGASRRNGGWGDVRDQTLCLSFARNRWLALSEHPSVIANSRDVAHMEPLLRGVPLTEIDPLS